MRLKAISACLSKILVMYLLSQEFICKFIEVFSAFKRVLTTNLQDLNKTVDTFRTKRMIQKRRQRNKLYVINMFAISKRFSNMKGYIHTLSKSASSYRSHLFFIFISFKKSSLWHTLTFHSSSFQSAFQEQQQNNTEKTERQANFLQRSHTVVSNVKKPAKT